MHADRTPPYTPLQGGSHHHAFVHVYPGCVLSAHVGEVLHGELAPHRSGR